MRQPGRRRALCEPGSLTCHEPYKLLAQVVRAPVGLAVVKVLRLVPDDDRAAALPGVLTSVANLLKSRQQGVRYAAKITADCVMHGHMGRHSKVSWRQCDTTGITSA